MGMRACHALPSAKGALACATDDPRLETQPQAPRGRRDSYAVATQTANPPATRAAEKVPPASATGGPDGNQTSRDRPGRKILIARIEADPYRIVRTRTSDARPVHPALAARIDPAVRRHVGESVFRAAS